MSRAKELTKEIDKILGKDKEEVMNELDKKRYVLLDKNEINRRKKQENPEADDFHLFEVSDRETIQKSCCSKFTFREESCEFVDYGRSEEAPEMRQIVLDKGRNVCGICVASLYSNRDTSKP